MTLTVAQPLVPVFHPDSEVLPHNSAVLNLQKQSECVSCHGDFEPNETGIVGHHTGVEGVWHAIHENCLRQWCLSKVQPSTKMVNCITCSAPLNVRSLFPRNSVREWVRILTGVAPIIRASAVGASAFYWGVTYLIMLKHVVNIPHVQTLISQNPWLFLAYFGSMPATLFTLDRAGTRALREGNLEAILAGSAAGIVAGSVAGLVALFRKKNPDAWIAASASFAAPLAAAIVALARNL